MADKIVRIIEEATKVIDVLKYLVLHLFLLAEVVKTLVVLYHH